MAVTFYTEKIKMGIIKTTVHNVETNEIETRKLNDEEIAQYLIDQQYNDDLKAKAQRKAESKAAAQAKLAALGLTVEDLQALGL